MRCIPANPWACELAAVLGYDAVFIDLEHGTINPGSADRMIALSRAMDLRVYVRVSGAERAPIQQALDAGAHGLVLPQIEGLSHATRSAGYAKYPDLGTRGMGTPRSQALWRHATRLRRGGGPLDALPGHDRDARRAARGRGNRRA